MYNYIVSCFYYSKQDCDQHLCTFFSAHGKGLLLPFSRKENCGSKHLRSLSNIRQLIRLGPEFKSSPCSLLCCIWFPGWLEGPPDSKGTAWWGSWKRKFRGYFTGLKFAPQFPGASYWAMTHQRGPWCGARTGFTLISHGVKIQLCDLPLWNSRPVASPFRRSSLKRGL